MNVNSPVDIDPQLFIAELVKQRDQAMNEIARLYAYIATLQKAQQNADTAEDTNFDKSTMSEAGDNG